MSTRRAFTLVEILVVVVIIGVVLALAVSAYLPHLRRAHALKNLDNVRTIAASVDLYYASPVIGSSLPVTFPSSAVTYSGSTSTYTAFASLDLVLLATGFLAQPLHWQHPAADWRPAGLPLRYDTVTRSFVDTGTYDSSLASQAAPCRVLSRVSTTVSPSSAAGGNFRLNGTDDLPANSVVVYAVLPNTPQLDAFALAEQLLPRDQLPAIGAACDYGKIAYAAADSSGLTSVYLYVTHR
jgi:prepilin-type N-terminal cleavage/methylation domain-containing protein